MDELTEKDDQGNWHVKGVRWEQLHEGQVITGELREKLYGALWKLMEYEDTGLSPEEVENLKEKCSLLGRKDAADLDPTPGERLLQLAGADGERVFGGQQVMRELIIDCFAGGGGASVGIEMALGRPVDIAINHDPQAIRMHKVNHPDTLHLTEDIFKVDLQRYVKGRRVALMWASPDCTSHSKAKGRTAPKKWAENPSVGGIQARKSNLARCDYHGKC